MSVRLNRIVSSESPETYIVAIGFRVEGTPKRALYRFVRRRRPFRLGSDGPVCIFPAT